MLSRINHTLALGIAAAVLLGLGSGPANGAFIAGFDVNGQGGPTEAGYASVNAANTVVTQNGISFSYANPSSGLRDRGASGNCALSPVPSVTRDFGHSDDGRGFANPYLSVDVTGLLANTEYDLRWHHFDNGQTNVANRLALYEDMNNDNSASGETKLFETATYNKNTTNFFTDFTATTNASGELHFAAGPHSAGRSINHLNGFEVVSAVSSVIPEPMTMLAVGMGVAGLGGYVRRRRRKMTTRKTLAVFLAVGMVLGLAGVAQATTIAANMAISTNVRNSVDPGESAIVGTDATDAAILGAANVDGSKWNHVLLGNTFGAPTIFPGATQGGNSIALLDTDGNAAGAMTSSGTFWSHWSDATDGPNRDVIGEAGLMQSYLLLSSNESVTVSLGSGVFDITVYAFFEIGRAGGSGDANRVYGLDVNGSSAYWTSDTSSTDSDADEDGFMEWRQALGTTQATATANANYAVFTGLTGSTVTFSGLGSQGRAVLSGFQIQATPIPEPATMGALGLAVTGLGGYIRKRRRA